MKAVKVVHVCIRSSKQDLCVAIHWPALALCADRAAVAVYSTQKHAQVSYTYTVYGRNHHIYKPENCWVWTEVTYCPRCLTADKGICHPCLLHIITHHCPGFILLSEGKSGGNAVRPVTRKAAHGHFGIFMSILSHPLPFSVFRSHHEARVQFLHWLQRLHNTGCNQ